MISCAFWFCFWSHFVVYAPPSFHINHNQSRETFSHFNPAYVPHEGLIRRSNMRTNRTSPPFDIHSYRSSWKFVDKTTVQVRFRLSGFLIHSMNTTRFLVRHMRTGSIIIINKTHEQTNSTVSLYLEHLNHGRHSVCLLVYFSRLFPNPKYVFCQDINFNYHKYGLADNDSDEHGNTVFFLLTQYTIVIGLLCILQLVHAARKRRFLKVVYEKASALRHLMMEYHHRTPENKSTPDLNNRKHALESLIYNFNRNALNQLDVLRTNNDGETTSDSTTPISAFRRSKYHRKSTGRDTSTKPLISQRRSVVAIPPSDHIDSDEDTDLDTRSYEEQSISYKSVSHIIDDNRPWMARLNGDGSIEHAIPPPKQTRTPRAHHV